MPRCTESRAWHRLEKHSRDIEPVDIPALFQSESGRAENCTVEGAGLALDFSKQAVTPETMRLLTELARDRGVPDALARLMQGRVDNPSEGRPVLHPALRDAPGTPGSVSKQVRAGLSAMENLVEAVHSGRWSGWSGQPFRDVVHIGIGGSGLGPSLVCHALQPAMGAHLRTHFVANADGAEMRSILTGLDPATTLFVVVSKTFTTQETRLNAETARQWMLARARDELSAARHFAAVTACPERARQFGIEKENVLTFQAGVGGRFSLWSPVGLVIALSLGMTAFRTLLAGARAMDEHALNTPLERNMPVLMALLGVWNSNFRGSASQVVVPYAASLSPLPRYLQQLEMESGGKSAGPDGGNAGVDTAPVIWGGVGTPAQHAFFQMLHQGTQSLPVDFVLPLWAHHDLEHHQRVLVANCLAQSAALMQGRGDEALRGELASRGLGGEELEAAIGQRRLPGNRPSSTLLLPRVEPASLGALLALYEHKVFVQSVLWGINAFDQWGVELGKGIAGDILQAMESGEGATLDPSTRALLARFLDSADGSAG